MTHNNPREASSPTEYSREGDPQRHPFRGVYESCGSPPSVGHDIYRRGGGLGLPAYRLLSHLDPDETSTAKELAEVAGLHPGSVRATLRRMGELGMAIRDDEGGWRATGFEPSRVAQEVGTAGKAAAQRRRLRDESLKRDEAVRRWRQWRTENNWNNEREQDHE